MANWFYAAGSICFLIGTIINMLPNYRGLTLRDFGQYRQMTPDEAARVHIPLGGNVTIDIPNGNYGTSPNGQLMPSGNHQNRDSHKQ